MTATAPQVRTKTEDEDLIGVFGFASKLTGSSAVIETPTVTASPSGLTIDTPAVNDAALDVDGISHAIGQAVLAGISGGTAGTKYTLKCTAVTDDGQTMVLYGGLRVET